MLGCHVGRGRGEMKDSFPEYLSENSLAAQCLELSAFTATAPSSIPGWGTVRSCKPWPKKEVLIGAVPCVKHWAMGQENHIEHC